jgi:hypothetical protein
VIRHLARAAAVVIVLATGAVRAEELRMTTLFRTGTVTQNVGGANLVVRDVNGDSRPEIISCAAGSAFAMSYDGSTYRDTWYSPIVGCTGVAVGDRDGNGSNQIFVGTAANFYAFSPIGPGYLYVFDPTSYGPELAKVQVSATEAVRDVAVGNVDGDPGLEVVALTNTKAYVYNAATLALKWTASYGGHTVAIGDLEGDGVKEIVIAGSNIGYVLDASAQTLKWSYTGPAYPQGFGPTMALGDVDNDGKAEILCGTPYGVSASARVINGDTMTVVTVPAAAQSITAGDANNDGQIELIVGPDQWGAVQGYSISGTTSTLLWSITNPDHGVQGMAVGDPDGDGMNEVLWGAGVTSSGADQLFIGNANTHTLEYSGIDLTGLFHVVVDDLDGDGKLEMVVLSETSATSQNSFAGPAAWVLDYTTHRLIATLSFPYNGGASEVAIGQVDGDPQKEIIFLGNPIRVFDGKTFAQEWASPDTGINSPVTSQHLIVKNIDGDAVDEIFYVTGSSFHVLNGASEFIQYSSAALDSSITDFAVADLDGDSVPDLVVATNTGLYVFKTSDWSQRIYIPLATFSSRNVAATAGHFAVTLNGGGVALYSGSTLAQEWICSSGNNISSLAFVDLAGQARLAALMSDETLRFFLTTGASCPAYDTISQSFGTNGYGNTHIAFKDLDGDGRPELLVGSSSAATVAVLGWPSEPRGDVDSDGVVTDLDIDALAAYLYGSRLATQPAADVNGDGAIRPDDLFYLINYRRGTGVPPPAQPAPSHSPGETQ